MRIKLFLGVAIVLLLLVGCADGGAAQGLTFDDLFPPLTPTNSGVATPVATPTQPPLATPTVTVAPPLATPPPVLTLGTAENPIVADTSADVSADGNWYIVVRGDHLWGIARHALSNATGAKPNNRSVSAYVAEIAAANKLRNPDLIHPGERFVLPVGR